MPTWLRWILGLLITALVTIVPVSHFRWVSVAYVDPVRRIPSPQEKLSLMSSPRVEDQDMAISYGRCRSPIDPIPEFSPIPILYARRIAIGWRVCHRSIAHAAAFLLVNRSGGRSLPAFAARIASAKAIRAHTLPINHVGIRAPREASRRIAACHARSISR